jgi:hypothetical protein
MARQNGVIHLTKSVGVFVAQRADQDQVDRSSRGDSR